ncbi:hypothetical protein KY358_02835 [Candidatus Woesearchaeota archaeon]|nr:hypothetical protein [Candidatus Woesearchaeota archaeon]
MIDGLINEVWSCSPDEKIVVDIPGTRKKVKIPKQFKLCTDLVKANPYLAAQQLSDIVRARNNDNSKYPYLKHPKPTMYHQFNATMALMTTLSLDAIPVLIDSYKLTEKLSRKMEYMECDGNKGKFVLRIGYDLKFPRLADPLKSRLNYHRSKTIEEEHTPLRGISLKDNTSYNKEKVINVIKELRSPNLKKDYSLALKYLTGLVGGDGRLSKLAAYVKRSRIALNKQSELKLIAGETINKLKGASTNGHLPDLTEKQYSLIYKLLKNDSEEGILNIQTDAVRELSIIDGNRSPKYLNDLSCFYEKITRRQPDFTNKGFWNTANKFQDYYLLEYPNLSGTMAKELNHETTNLDIKDPLYSLVEKAFSPEEKKELEKRKKIIQSVIGSINWLIMTHEYYRNNRYSKVFQEIAYSKILNSGYLNLLGS